MLHAREMNDMTKTRRAEVQRLLKERQRQIQQDVQLRMRDGRAGRAVDRGDIGDFSEAASQEEFDFAILERKAESLHRVDEALGRIEKGEFGECLECHAEISEERLRALPFAVRCTACEARREQENAARRSSSWQDAAPAFARVSGSY
jgi:DnaK suppressor protein